MGKTGKWIKNLLTGKKDHSRHHHHHKENSSSFGTVKPETTVHNNNNASSNGQATPISIAQPTTPKEKRRWSFRRSSANGTAPPVPLADHHGTAAENEDSKKHALAVAAATAAAADAAVAAAKAAAAVIQLTSATSGRGYVVEDAAAVKIQSVFRGYLARKALNALKGLVKLQALVRGHLVRKQATATLRCMQALVTAQARARAQRLRMVEESSKSTPPKHYFNHRKSTQGNTFRTASNQQDLEENVKIVEMDIGDHYKPVAKSRNSCSNHTAQQPDPVQPRISTHRASIKHEHHQQQKQQQISPSPSAITDMSPRTCSNHFEEYSSFGTAQSSPQRHSKNDAHQAQARLQFSYPRSEYAESLYGEYPFYPSYMANTESSRAKVRSHSAPKQRPAETIERQTSRRRPSLEGRNVPRAVRMQRSSSQVGSGAQSHQYPWSVKLDRSAVSLKDSECGSTSTVTTNVNYCRSLVGFDVQGGRY